MPSETHTRPNVLLICTDHWPGALMRPAGHPTVMTPTLSNLAHCGVSFARNYSATPVCVAARRTLMTGLSARGHGVVDNSGEPMPAVPTLAQCFRDAGYQAYAVGKLHVFPARSRIGFDDVVLIEEGRPIKGSVGPHGDDWDQAVADAGYPGQTFGSGMSSNDYMARPWQLPEHLHPTNWAAAQMCRSIARRDPSKPGFWYLSFLAPHPPMWPPQSYLDLYRDVPIDEPVIGEWARDPQRWPHALQYKNQWYTIRNAPRHEVELALRAFYACCTHIDHQIRLVIGTLREQGLLNNTIIAFTSDHGDMLGTHGQWAKQVMYDMSARVPLIIVPARGDTRLKQGTQDTRLTELRDVMPTLLDLAGVPIPPHVEGMSLIMDQRREYLFGECGGELGYRMIREGRYKLIYYPLGNHRQLFDIQEDPQETRDLAGSAAHAEHLDRLTQRLTDSLYGDNLQWVRQGKLVGVADRPVPHRDTRDMGNQRGLRYI